MSVLHGPVPVRTVGDLRQVLKDLHEVEDSTELCFSMTDEELQSLNAFPNTWEASALIVDAVADADDERVVTFSPWQPRA